MRNRLSYANVMATVAVFLALGGGAYAAIKLPKDSVTSKQIKNKSVKGKDLAGKAVKSAKIKPDAINGSKVKDDSLTGADIDESTLAGVDAARVGGVQVKQMSYKAGPNTGPQQLFSLGGLTVTATCPSVASDSVTLTASTDADDSIISLPNRVWTGPGGLQEVGTQNDFDAGVPLSLQIDDTTATMVYGRGPDSSPIVTAEFLANQFSNGGTDGTCKVVGTVMSNG